MLKCLFTLILNVSLENLGLTWTLISIYMTVTGMSDEGGLNKVCMKFNSIWSMIGNF